MRPRHRRRLLAASAAVLFIAATAGSTLASHGGSPTEPLLTPTLAEVPDTEWVVFKVEFEPGAQTQVHWFSHWHPLPQGEHMIEGTYVLHEDGSLRSAGHASIRWTDYNATVRSDTLAVQTRGGVEPIPGEMGNWTVGTISNVQAPPEGLTLYYTLFSNQLREYGRITVNNTQAEITGMTYGNGTSFKTVDQFDHVPFAVVASGSTITIGARDAQQADSWFLADFGDHPSGALHEGKMSWSGPDGMGDPGCITQVLPNCTLWYNVAGPPGTYEFVVDYYASASLWPSITLLTAEVELPT